MTFRPEALLERLRGTVAGLASGQAVLAVGGACLLVLVVTALLPDRVDTATGRGPAAGAGTTVGILPAALPGLSPFTPATPLQFGGRVTQVASFGNDVGWGQVHIWIDDGTGALREISVAPQSYLNQIGCPSFDGARVSGIGFQFDLARPTAELYAKTIVVGGRTCRLRDDEGLALWMNVGQ